MLRISGPLFFFCAWSLINPPEVNAAGTRSFRQTTARDFEEGEATSAMVLPSGEVMAGQKALQAPIEAAFAWCAALSPDGKTGYFGTGDKGRIFAVPVGGTDAPTPRKLAEVDAPWVTSLAVRPDGLLLAGSTPGGRVFAVDPRTGTSRVFAKVAAEHVWALHHDPKSGTTYAAAGAPGKLFAIDAKGAARMVWDSGDKHIVSLSPHPEAGVLVGTAETAILYRVTPDGRATALHDFDADELRAIVRVGAVTYLAVNDFEKSGGDGGASTMGAPTAVVTAAPRGTKISGAAPAPASVGSPPRPGATKAKSAVYRLSDDGAIESVFSLTDGYITALLRDSSGDVFAAAGSQGKLYRLFGARAGADGDSRDRSFALVADLPERQILSLLPAPEGFLLGTGDVGAIYRVRPVRGTESTYLSKVFDADQPARWGRLRFSGSTSLVIETRSGQTAKPDKTWPDWRRLEDVQRSGPESDGRIGSPPSRYLQYRVGFVGGDATLKDVQIHYLAQNQRPRVLDVTTLADGGAPGPGFGVTAPVVRSHSPVVKLRFRMDNPDGDDLLFKLWFRRSDESLWRPFGPPEPLTKPEYDWNTESIPDGRYLVRVWVSDERSTPRDRAMDSTFVSVPFLVDNTRPDIVELAASGAVVSGRARDSGSPIAALDMSIDGQEFRPVAPTDGILDQVSESFSVRLPAGVGKGPHIVNIRALDVADNVGAGRIAIDVK